MPDLGKLSATASLDAHGISSGIAEARAGLAKLKDTILSVGATLGVSFAAFLSMEGIADGFKGIFEAGKDLKAQSAITGESIKDLVVLGQAYKEAGLDAGTVTTNLVMLQKALGGVNEEGLPTKKIFNQLGLNMAQLKSETAVQQFQAISKAISNLGDQSSKTAAIAAIFGRGGAQMEALFSNPAAIEEASKAVGGFGAVMQQNAAIFARISNSFELLGEQSQRFFGGLASQVAPMLDGILTKLQGIDLTKLGTQVGAAVRVAYAAFQGGDLTRLIGLSLQGGIEIGLSALTDPHTWEALGDLIKGSFRGLAAIVLDAFKPALGAMGAMTEDAVSKLTGGRIDPQKDAAQTVYDNSNRAINGIGAEQLKVLDNKQGLPQGEVDKRYNELQKLYIQAVSDRDSAAGMIKPGGPDIGDRYNFLANQGGPLDQVQAQLGASSGSSFAEAAKRMQEALASLKDVAPEIKRQIGAIIGKYQFMATPSGPSGDKAPGGGGKLQDFGEAMRGKGVEADRLAKIGLYVGGSTPQQDHARRTADNTAKAADILKQVRDIDSQILAGMNQRPLSIFG